MAAQPIIDPLDSARAAISQALEQWDATDLSRIRRFNALVESAVSALQAFALAQARGECIPSRNSRQVLAEIQIDARRMSRMVDACLAFQRGLLLRLGGAAPAYGAQGTVLEAPCRSDFYGMEA